MRAPIAAPMAARFGGNKRRRCLTGNFVACSIFGAAGWPLLSIFTHDKRQLVRTWRGGR
jgi:hypothetical protein